MKKCPSVFRLVFTAIIASTVGVGAFSGIANAQTSSTNNAGAPVPTAAVPQAPALAYGVGEVVKMYQGGINKDVIINYIDNTALPYHLTADAILYLQNLGMPQEITKTMIQRDGQLAQQQMAMQQQFYQQQRFYQQQQPMPPPGQAQAQYGGGSVPPPTSQEVVPPSTPAPPVTVVGTDPTYYDYGYPDYGWPYYYGYGGPVVIGGWGWGHGWGYGGFHGGSHGGFGGFGGHGGFGGGHGGGGGHR